MKLFIILLSICLNQVIFCAHFESVIDDFFEREELYKKKLSEKIFKREYKYIEENLDLSSNYALYLSLNNILAASICEETLIKYIKEKKINLEIENEQNRNLLHWAALQGLEKLAKFLLNFGFDVNSTDIFGQTPLHFAVLNGSINLVQILLRYKADANHLTTASYLQNFYESPFKLNPPDFNWRLTRQLANDIGANIKNDLKYAFVNFSPMHYAILKGNKNLIDALKPYYCSSESKATVRVCLIYKGELYTEFEFHFAYEHFCLLNASEKYFKIVNDSGFCTIS